MSMRVLQWAMQRDAGKGHAQLLLYVLAFMADDDGIVRSIAERDLIQPACQSRATIFRSLNVLEQRGLLRRIGATRERPGISGQLLVARAKSL